MTIPPLSPTQGQSRPEHRIENPELYKAAQALEGVFVQEMYKAMRTTVPTNPILPESGGEEMFTSLLDEHLAADTPQQWDNGLSSAIYRQLLRSASQSPSASS
jgi:flagellar protein FlgJ